MLLAADVNLTAVRMCLQVHDVIYGNWLIMVRAGVLALEYYSPASDTWRQVWLLVLGLNRESR